MTKYWQDPLLEYKQQAADLATLPNCIISAVLQVVSWEDVPTKLVKQMCLIQEVLHH